MQNTACGHWCLVVLDGIPDLGYLPHIPRTRSPLRLREMPDQALILIVDDSDDDCMLVQRAFIKAKVLNPLLMVRSGEEAIAYLSGTGKYANRAEYPLPGLILLDIKMKGLDGLDVLRWTRSQPGLQGLRIVMLTSSDDMRDVNEAYRFGANSFLVKPVDSERFIEIAQALSGYWLWTDMAPDAHRPPPKRAERPAEASSQPPGERKIPSR